MTVLHVHSGNLFGGVERMLQTLAPASAGLSPVASSYALCFEGAVAEALRGEGGTVHDLGTVRARRPDEIRRARRVLRRVLESHHPTVAMVHSAWSQAIFGPAVLDSGVPLVRWLHAPQPGPRWLEAWASRSRPSLVICNSRYTLENAGTRVSGVSSDVIYPPAKAPHPAVGARSAVRTALGTPSSAVVVMLASRLEAGKGHGLLIDALARLHRPEWEAWIVGGAQQDAERLYFEALQGRARAAGIADRIRFLGQRQDVADLFAAADVYCQPNVAADSFGLSFVEALASGLPVVTARLGGAPEIVDETCGVLVKAGDVDELTAALRTMIGRDEERRQFAAAARVRARMFCDTPAVMTRLASLLADLGSPVAVA